MEAAVMEKQEVAVTLTPDLFQRLQIESQSLGVPLSWVVASLIVDTMQSGLVESGPLALAQS